MKETGSKDLLMIGDAGNRNTTFSPPSAGRLFEQPRNGNPESTISAASVLTDRQTEVLKLIAEGNSSKEIAGLLSLSIKTVEKHRQAVMDKLDIHEIATLTRYAVFAGIIECRRPIRGRDATLSACPDLSGFASAEHRLALPNDITANQ
jgi:DNA-binding NarL/FixJ family response regulator